MKSGGCSVPRLARSSVVQKGKIQTYGEVMCPLERNQIGKSAARPSLTARARPRTLIPQRCPAGEQVDEASYLDSWAAFGVVPE